MEKVAQPMSVALVLALVMQVEVEAVVGVVEAQAVHSMEVRDVQVAEAREAVEMWRYHACAGSGEDKPQQPGGFGPAILERTCRGYLACGGWQWLQSPLAAVPRQSRCPCQCQCDAARGQRPET